MSAIEDKCGSGLIALFGEALQTLPSIGGQVSSLMDCPSRIQIATKIGIPALENSGTPNSGYLSARRLDHDVDRLGWLRFYRLSSTKAGHEF
jgi:hypothetical protein